MLEFRVKRRVVRLTSNLLVVSRGRERKDGSLEVKGLGPKV